MYQRYSRQLLLPEVGTSGQEKLHRASVLVIGAGGLGCPVLQYLAAAGVGHLGIADSDKVELSNLHRQVLYRESQVGMPKAEAAAHNLKELNTELRCTCITEGITPQNAVALVDQYDLVVEGTDSIDIKYLTDAACREAGKAWVGGGLHRMEGEVAVYNYRGSPGYSDLYPRRPAPGTVVSCAEEGVLGVLPGLVGVLMANECLKLLLDYGDTLAGKVLRVDAADLKFMVFDLPGSNKDTSASIHAADALPVMADRNLLNAWEAAGEPYRIIDIRSAYLKKQQSLGYEELLPEEVPAAVQEDEQLKTVLLCQTGATAAALARSLRRAGNQNVFAMRLNP